MNASVIEVVIILIKELLDCSQRISECMVRWGTRNLPEPYRTEVVQEILGDIDQESSRIIKLVLAVGVIARKYPPEIYKERKLHISTYQDDKDKQHQNNGEISEGDKDKK